MRQVTQHSSSAERTTGMRAAQSWTLKILKQMAMNQYQSGDFSRYLMPSRRAVTQSPESSILRAICACTPSTSSIRDGGLTAQPPNIRSATKTVSQPEKRKRDWVPVPFRIAFAPSSVASRDEGSADPTSDIQD